MDAVHASCRTVGALDEPGKRFISLLITQVFFRFVEHDLFSDKIFQGVTDVLTGFSRRQAEGFCIMRNGNFALTVVEIFTAGGFRSADLVDKKIQHPLLIAGKTVGSLSQFI